MGPPMGPPMGAPLGPPPLGPPMGPPMMMGCPAMMGVPPLGPPRGAPMGMPQRRPDEPQVFAGAIIQWDSLKGFGFCRTDSIPEDIFFLKSEMPQDLKEEKHKDKVVGQRVDFEVFTMPDGKIRARRMARLITHQPGRRPQDDRRPSDAGPGPAHGGPARRVFGSINKYDKGKGYGFIRSAITPENIFFLRSSLPKDMTECESKELIDLDVSFDFFINEEGKPRAGHIEVSSGHDDRPQPSSAPDEEDQDGGISGDVCTGRIVRYDSTKGFGFVKSDEHTEDIFFLRGQMPTELGGAQRKEEVEGRRVEFEVKVMPDGKMRAQRMTLLEDQGHEDEPRSPPPLPDLDDFLLDEMTDVLFANRGGMDYGKFASQFPKVKKRQLEPHFDIVAGPRGGDRGQRIELPEHHPRRVELREEAEAEERMREEERMHEEAPAEDDAVDDDGTAQDDPAIPLLQGCQPLGVIHQYDPGKGFGFIKVPGHPQDIFFTHEALPDSFRSRNKSDLPELIGVEVSFVLNPSHERGPRAENINLLLRWHAGDECWLLKRI